MQNMIEEYERAEQDENWIYQDSIRYLFRSTYGYDIEDYIEGKVEI